MNLGNLVELNTNLRRERLFNQERAPLLIHVGLHKTGSTWLQKQLFSDRKRGFSDSLGESRNQLKRRMITPDPLFYDAGATAKHYAPRLAAARQAGLTMVISHERLSGHPSAGGRDRCMIAERLHATFPDARVLLVIREQRNLIRSMYNQHIKSGGVESLRHYFAEPDHVRKPSFSLQIYEFDRLVGFYRDLFGHDRVLVLPMEMLAKQPQDFVDRIAAFSGHPSVPLAPVKRRNTRRPHLMRVLQRPLNALFFRNELSPGALFHIRHFNRRFSRLRFLFKRLSPRPLEQFLDDREMAAVNTLVGDYYAASNRRTQEMIGLPLAKLGYPVEPLEI